MKQVSGNDRRLLLILGATLIGILVAVSLVAKPSDDSDPRPTTYNAGSAGAKAAFLVLQGMSRNVGRWEQPLSKLDAVTAQETTLVLAEPRIDILRRKEEGADLQRFLQRGGRVLLTGSQWASLLPGGGSGPPSFLQGDLCVTTPEGPGALAGAGEVEMTDAGGWAAKGPQFRVEQRCGKDAVVVRFPVGQGEAVWWSSSSPLSNAGLKKDGNLKLLLASLDDDTGEPRRVLFDEYVQEAHVSSNVLKGLPLWWLFLQFAAAFALLVWSFSRRKGPLRMPVQLPRSSPVEFATSMGNLYSRAGATNAATDAAKRRLLEVLRRDAGVGRAAIEAGPDAVVEVLSVRLHGDWNGLAQHLREAEEASREPFHARSALALVQELDEDERRVREALRPTSAVNMTEGEAVVSGK